MPNLHQQTKKSVWFRLFLATALVFLLFGMCLLGSFRGTGDAYELKARPAGSTSASVPNVILELDEPEDTSLRVVAAYVNVGAVYLEAGVSATLRLEAGRTSSSYTSSRRYEIEAENLFAEQGEEAGTVEVLYTWAEFPIPENGWEVADFPYVRLSSQDQGANILVNELVLVGERTDGTGGLRTIPLRVVSATQLVGESEQDAEARAMALIDAQAVPLTAPGKFARFSDAEISVLMSIAEMRVGSAYGEGNVYHGERVYGAFGVDLLAFGTIIFGNSPFGLRFFPMLAAFGALVFGYYFVRDLSKSEKAGFVFAVLYALACVPLALGGLGTPLMIGVFFLAASLYFCHRFYARGMRKNSFSSAVPLLLSGLFAACAICVNGAFVIPVAGIAGLFAAGMVRQQRARRYHLDKAIAEAEAEAPAAEGEERVSTPGEKKAVAVVQEYRSKNAYALSAFLGALIVGGFIISLLFLLPAYPVYVKLYDDPSAPAKGIFSFLWQSFSGGFTGVNEGVSSASPWNIFYLLGRTQAGTFSAVWGAFVNPAALLAALAGIAYAVYRIVAAIRGGLQSKQARAALRGAVIPLAGVVLSLIAASFGQGALAFILMAYLFSFVSAACAVRFATEAGGKAGKAARVCTYAAFGLLAAMFVLYFVFTFGIPVASSLIVSIFG